MGEDMRVTSDLFFQITQFILDEENVNTMRNAGLFCVLFVPLTTIIFVKQNVSP